MKKVVMQLRQHALYQTNLNQITHVIPLPVLHYTIQQRLSYQEHANWKALCKVL